MQEIKNISAYRRGLKGKILRTAIKLFAKNGIKSVTMDDISHSLNISKRTIYEIYDKKEVLLFECIKSYYEKREREMDKFVMDNPNVMDIILNVYRLKVVEFRKTSPIFYEEIELYPTVMAYFEKKREENRQQMFDFMSKGTQEGYFRGDIDKSLVILLFDSIGHLFIEKRLYRHYSIESVLNNMMLITLRGICTAKGIEVLDRFLKSQTQ